jgi:isochorismate synthase EntC
VNERKVNESTFIDRKAGDFLNSIILNSLYPLYYFCSKDDDFEVLVAGTSSVPDMEMPQLLLTKFDDLTITSSEWKWCDFNTYHTPNIAIVTEKNKTSMSGDSKIIDSILSENINKKDQVKHYLNVNYELIPSDLNWNRNIAKTLEFIDSKLVYKIVLARRATIKNLDNKFTNIIDCLSLISPNVGSESFLFFYQKSPKNWFLSVSPERLFQICGDTIKCDVIGGTVTAENTFSGKHYHEHKIILDELKNNLSKICNNKIDVTSVEPARFGNLYHLYAMISGEIKKSTKVEDILQLLHPTSAVAGSPKFPAKEFIRTNEGFDRGLYSGAITIILPNRTESIVGIRSLMRSDNEMYLYGGCGIVNGSNAEDEATEVKYKFKSFNINVP